MSELEDKLNKILSSPADMEKIMGIARSLSGSLGAQQPQGEAAAAAAPAPDFNAIASGLKDIDPKIFKLVTRLVSEYSSAQNDKSELLKVIKPYLKEDRREKIDRAAEIAKLAKLARVAFREFSGGEKGV
ncbi:hypothetical protein SAMN02745823_01452 [Sporobacter termitidis DSM 10068]|uniref:Uncharacterized protein n=1 Tax=Sporobacter termitidis DSM 10068 TaxID=1123282 RepID=A0A1M5WXB2_9FIRM|nr:hypothetical protein [Sporobacter termitidis]SHH92345.1 hypothetical protein SAMN02745823_01452 [Sporobacter termitidis DSM 10068]